MLVLGHPVKVELLGAREEILLGVQIHLHHLLVAHLVLGGRPFLILHQGTSVLLNGFSDPPLLLSDFIANSPVPLSLAYQSVLHVLLLVFSVLADPSPGILFVHEHLREIPILGIIVLQLLELDIPNEILLAFGLSDPASGLVVFYLELLDSCLQLHQMLSLLLLHVLRLQHLLGPLLPTLHRALKQ